MRKVEVVAYDPGWVGEFESEARRLTSVLGAEVVAIHHYGSTAIPGLCAKPIIDILVEVKDIEAIDALNQEMEVLGYEARGERGFSGRRYFVREEGGRRTHHVHMYQSGHPEIERWFRFRDYLLARPGEAEAYGSLKRSLAERFPYDAPKYNEGKTCFVRRVDELARAWRGGEAG